MMMLELDYMASFNEPYTDGDKTTLHFSGLTLFMVAVFVLLMPILLMNLLVSLHALCMAVYVLLMSILLIIIIGNLWRPIS